jgi:hypothetical protein
MIVTDNELHAAHSAFQKALEEHPPVVFGRAEFEAAALCGCSDCASATPQGWSADRQNPNLGPTSFRGAGQWLL